MFQSRFQIFLEELFQTFLSLIKLLFLSKWNVKLPNPEIRDELLILGNGPSLKKVLTERINTLCGKDLLCVNFFPESPEYERVKPRYFITAAPELWRNSADPKFRNRGKALFETLASKTTWDMVVFLPAEVRKYPDLVRLLTQNPRLSLCYFNNTALEGFRWFLNLVYQWNLGMPRPHNVLIPALMLGINMGYKNLFLFGADHSWIPNITVDENNRVLINQKHFYDETTSKAKPMHKAGRGHRRLHEVLMKFVYSFRAYFVIKNYAERKKTRILNATPGSFIDAFERVNYFEIKLNTK